MKATEDIERWVKCIAKNILWEKLFLCTYMDIADTYYIFTHASIMQFCLLAVKSVNCVSALFCIFFCGEGGWWGGCIKKIVELNGFDRYLSPWPIILKANGTHRYCFIWIYPLCVCVYMLLFPTLSRLCIRLHYNLNVLLSRRKLFNIVSILQFIGDSFFFLLSLEFTLMGLCVCQREAHKLGVTETAATTTTTPTTRTTNKIFQ